MSVNGGPNISENGLVFSLDAADKTSYPGTGTAWNDLVGNNNGTLTNGPTFSTDGKGSIVFDGVDDYVTADSNVFIQNQITVSSWINHTAISNGVKRYLTVGIEDAVIRQNNSAGELQFYIKTDSIFRVLNVSNYLIANTWYHVVGTWNGTNMRLYSNGVNIASTSPGGTIASGSKNYVVSLQVEPMNGRIATAQIYNRALTQTEVLQNYNALKSRFNLQ